MSQEITTHSRQLRCEPQSWPTDSNKEGTMRLADGNLGRHIEIKNSDLVAHFNDGKKGCFVDDVLARLRDILIARPNKSKRHLKAIELIQLAIGELDTHAVETHGYSWDQEERDYVPPY